MKFFPLVKAVIRALFYPAPKIGDKYLFDELGDDDPFRHKPIPIEVVAIKDKYVQYKYKSGDLSSSEIGAFNFCYYRIDS